MNAGLMRMGLMIGGGIAGSFIGMPALGMMAGGLAGSLLFPGPDPPAQLGPRLGDLSVQVSAYGNPIPDLYGTNRVAGNIIWNSTVREIGRRTSQGGGKGGAPKQESVNFEYYVDLQIALCTGVIDGIGRVWANDKLIYDFQNPPHARGWNARIYHGTETQLPDPTIEADKGIGNVPAYRGLAYVVLKDLDLGQFSNAIPTFHFEVIAQGKKVVEAIEHIDDPVNGGFGRVAIDPDTGLVWTTRNSTGKIDIFRVNNGLQRIRQIDHPKAMMLSYMPSFYAVSIDAIGNVGQLIVPPKMWAGSNAPDSMTDGRVLAYATDGSGRIIDEIESPLGGGHYFWPGAVIVDLSSIDTEGPNFDSGPTLFVGATNGAGRAVGSWSLNPLVRGGGANPGDSFEQIGGLKINPPINLLADAGIHHIADWCQCGEFIVGIDRNGRLFLLESVTWGYTPFYNVVNVVTAVSGWASMDNAVTYDPEERMIYTKAREYPTSRIYMAKWDRNLVQQWERWVNAPADQHFVPARIRYHPGVGDVWVVGRDSLAASTARRVNKHTGEYDDVFPLDLTAALDDFQPFPGAPFAIGTRIGNPGATVKFPLGEGAVPEAPSLAEVVKDLCLRTGMLEEADIDVSELVPYSVHGYVVSQRQPVRHALQPLMQAYFFDAVESEDRIKFVRRGHGPVAIIPPEHLNARRDGETNPGSPVTEERVQETEMPISLDVRYIEPGTDYKPGIVTARRLIGDSHQKRTLDIPIVLEAAEAKAVVDVLMNNIWFERNKKGVSLDKRYLVLEPCDVVQVTTPDQGDILVRIATTSFSIPNLMQLEVMEEDPDLYDGYTSPAAIGLQPQPGMRDTPPVTLLVLDTATLRSVDNQPGVYVVAYAIGGLYDWAEVFQSPDGTMWAPGAALPDEGRVGFTEDRLTWEGSFS